MIRPLCDLTIKRLEQIFDPPGLPLVAKTDDHRHTTSLLIQGGPGTGKTTLALALGHALARDGDGLLLYLTTEFSPAELRFKADVLRLADRGAEVAAHPPERQGSPASAGSVYVAHLNTTPPADTDEPQGSLAKKITLLDAVWELLGICDEHPVPTLVGRPIRALVIDAFILPDPGKDDSELRTDLVNLIQALEFAGISPILLEEVVPDTPSSWLPFVVDIVFHLGHRSRVHQGQLERTLTCTKSRYGFVSAGPHIYALADRVPALFPALRHAATLPKIANPLRAVLHVQEHGLWAKTSPIAGGVIIYHTSGMVSDSGFLKELLNTPGAIPLTIALYSPIQIMGPAGPPRLVEVSDGPTALVWELLDAAAHHRANVLIFQSPARLFRDESWVHAIETMLLLLRNLGFVAVLEDHAALVSEPGAVFDLTVREDEVGENHYPVEIVESHASFARHTIAPPSDTDHLEGIRWSARSQIDDPLFERYISLLNSKGEVVPRNQRWRDVHQALRKRENSSSRTFDSSKRVNQLAATALLAGNELAMDPLQDAILEDFSRHAELLATLIRARALWQGVAPAEASAELFFTRFPAHWAGMMPWLRERVLAEIRLESSDPADQVACTERLLALLENAPLPLLHRYEVSYNLALAYKRLGEHGQASRWLHEALQIHPCCDLGIRLQKELTRLRA